MTNEELKISVIIPVYNAGPYVRKAVESALEQPETAEVLLIEDGSPDNSLEECKKLDAEYEKVRLFTHENNTNLGAGLSRNVGIDNARFEYVAFLDADDYYLPNRFRAERILEDHPDIDGVYGAVGRHYYSEEERHNYKKNGRLDLVATGLSYSPDVLFEAMIGMRPFNGFIHANALTLRRSAFEKVGKFADFVLHQDTEFIVKLTYCCRIAAGEISKPVANLGIHPANRISKVSRFSDSRESLFRELVKWAEEKDLPGRYITTLRNRQLAARIMRFNRFSGFAFFLKELLFHPHLLRDRKFWGPLMNHFTGGLITRLYLGSGRNARD